MKKITFLLIAFLSIINLVAQERETIWPKGKMPNRQAHQIAAMTDEAGQKDFNADKHRIAYLE